MPEIASATAAIAAKVLIMVDAPRLTSRLLGVAREADSIACAAIGLGRRRGKARQGERGQQAEMKAAKADGETLLHVRFSFVTESLLRRPGCPAHAMKHDAISWHMAARCARTTRIASRYCTCKTRC